VASDGSLHRGPLSGRIVEGMRTKVQGQVRLSTDFPVEDVTGGELSKLGY